MNISGYGVSYNYNNYGTLYNKAKTTSAFTIIPDEKPKTETKNNTTTNTTNTYNPFKDMAETGSVSLPSWIYTKTEPTRSDEEILKDIVEVAKRHAKQGTFQYEDNEFESLVKEWVSPVSPDREEILKNAMKEINEGKKTFNSQKNTDKEENFDMIDTLMQALKITKKEVNKKADSSNGTTSNGNGNGQIIFNMSGDTYDAFVEDGIVKAAMIRDNNGQVVMTFDNKNGLGQSSLMECGTEEEGVRRSELLKVYNEAYKEASSSQGLISGNSFEAVG